MTRSHASAAALSLLVLACAPPPPGQPVPERLHIDALVPSTALDAARASCVSARLAAASDAGGLRAPKARRARVQPDPLAAAPGALGENLVSWNGEPVTRAAAARGAVDRIRSDWYAAADYSELADMHARAFALAAEGTPLADRHLRETLELLGRMASSQPDLEALYQQAFEAMYANGESCAR
jgi:hypothetical protein